jgi:SprT protein
MDMERFAEITRKTNEVLERARQLYGVDIKPTISYNLRGRVAGWAGCRYCMMTRQARDFRLRFNSDLINGKHFEDIRDETVPHEVAHLVCYARPDLGRKHDAGWRRVCIALGGNGKTRHDYDVVPAAGGFTYRASCGREVTVSAVIHRKIQAGQTRVLKKTRGRIDRNCAWAPHGQALPTTTPAPGLVQRIINVVRPAPAPVAPPVQAARPVANTGGVSKAEQVRGFIREARVNGGGQDWVITRAMINLGMPRGQATKYVTENWSRA